MYILIASVTLILKLHASRKKCQLPGGVLKVSPNINPEPFGKEWVTYKFQAFKEISV